MLSDDFFSHIEDHFNNKLPFVAYRNPNDSVIKGFFQKTNEVYYTKNFEESGFVFSPFDDNEETILIPLEHSEFLSSKLEASTTNDWHQYDNEVNESEKASHLNLIQKGIDIIKNDRLQKVVLSRCETLSFSETQSISAYKRLLQNYHTAFVYFWYHPNVGLWLGATPETLISVSGNRFKTMALAGTQVYKDTMQVSWKPKELEEQKFVTDYIQDRLKLITNSLIVSEAKTVKAGTLLHLQSKINGILNTDLQTVLKALHPTPAVCGLPVNEAKAFILENELYNREYYTGFLGELNLKQITSRNTNKRNVENNAYNSVKTISHLFVNLRCMQIKNNQALIYVGGGITKDSNSQHEWEETVSKAETMKRVLSF